MQKPRYSVELPVGLNKRGRASSARLRQTTNMQGANRRAPPRLRELAFTVAFRHGAAQ